MNTAHARSESTRRAPDGSAAAPATAAEPRRAKTAPSIAFKDVGLVYESADGPFEALHDVTWNIAPGEPVAIIGPSGCGKSTTLHLIAGLMQPTAGTVQVGGCPIDRPRAATSFIPQDLGLFPWKTVFSNAELGLKLRGVPRDERRVRTEAALREVQLEGFEKAFPRELSGGMRQRLALARAIAVDMDLLLMDEPLSAIDALLRETLQQTLLELWQRSGHTQVLVTHSIEEAVFLGRRIFVMSPRPGTLVRVVDNPHMGEPGFRDSHDYDECCRTVRRALEAGARGAECDAGDSDANEAAYAAARGEAVR